MSSLWLMSVLTFINTFSFYIHTVSLSKQRGLVRGYGKQKRTTHIKSFVPVKVQDKYLFALSTLVLTILIYCDHWNDISKHWN